MSLSRFYRHIAPLERKVESFSCNRKLVDFQNLATWLTLSVITYKMSALEEGVMRFFFADRRGGTVAGKEFCVVGQRKQVIPDPGKQIRI